MSAAEGGGPASSPSGADGALLVERGANGGGNEAGASASAPSAEAFPRSSQPTSRASDSDGIDLHGQSRLMRSESVQVTNAAAQKASAAGALPPSEAGLRWRRFALEGEARYEWLLRRWPPRGRAELALIFTAKGVECGRHFQIAGRLREAGLVVAAPALSHGAGALLLVHAPERALQAAAEGLGERLRLRWAVGGGRAPYTRASARSFIGGGADGATLGVASASQGGAGDVPHSAFSPSIRLSLLERLVTDGDVGAGINLSEEMRAHYIADEGAVPLHDREIADWLCQRVGHLWPPSRWSPWPIVDGERFRKLREQGRGLISALLESHGLASSSLIVDDLCFYSGHQTAIYFLFLSFLCSQIAPLALIGICVWAARLAVRVELGDTPTAARVGSALDISFALMVSLWATAVEHLWERREARFAVRWGGGHKVPAEDNPRHAFYSLKTKANPLGLQVLATGEVVRHYPLWRRKAKQAASALLFVTLAAGLGVLMYWCFHVWFKTDDLGIQRVDEDGNVIEEEAIDLRQPASLRRFLPSAIGFGLVLPIVVYAADVLAERLTGWENYRLQAHHDDAVTAKSFPFQVLAMYFTVFVIAFGHVDLSCVCVPEAKLDAVQAQLYSQVGALTVIRCFVTDTAKFAGIALVTWALKWITRRRFRSQEEEDDDDEGSGGRRIPSLSDLRGWGKRLLNLGLRVLYPPELLSTIVDGALEMGVKVKRGGRMVLNTIGLAPEVDVESPAGLSDGGMSSESQTFRGPSGSGDLGSPCSVDEAAAAAAAAEAAERERTEEAYVQAAGFKIKLRTEYSEAMLLLGFGLLFSSVFPLMPLIAGLNWWLEIRLDARKFMRSRRQFTYRVATIGVWKSVLRALSLGGVLTNIAVIIVTLDLGSAAAKAPPSHKLLIALAVEHVVLALKAAIAFFLPKTPRDVAEEERRQRVVRARSRGGAAPIAGAATEGLLESAA